MSAAGGSIRVEAAVSSRKAEISELQRESCLWTGVALSLLGVFAALSVYSWTPADGWAYLQGAITANAAVVGAQAGLHNLGGTLGNWLGTHLLSLYGYAGYLIPPTLLGWGIFLIAKRSMQRQWLRLTGCLVLLTCLMLLMGVFGEGAKGDAGSQLPCGAGGVAGSVVLAPAVRNLLGPAGTVLFTALLAIGALYLVWAGFLVACVEKFTRLATWAGRTSHAALQQSVAVGRQAMQGQPDSDPALVGEAGVAGAPASMYAGNSQATGVLRMPVGAILSGSQAQVPVITGPQPALNSAGADYQHRVRVGSMSRRDPAPAVVIAKDLHTADLPIATGPVKEAKAIQPGVAGVAGVVVADTAVWRAETVEPNGAALAGGPVDLPTDCLDLPVTAKQAHRGPPAVEISEIEIAWETHKRREQHLEDDGESIEETDALIAIARAAAERAQAQAPAQTQATKPAPAAGKLLAAAAAAANRAPVAPVAGNDSADHAEIVQPEAGPVRGLKVKHHDLLEAEKKAARAAAKKKGGA
ncbi:MAG: DNA translocase FtsK 4TM domain-containing protein, partial [Planctomycetota bacterium]